MSEPGGNYKPIEINLSLYVAEKRDTDYGWSVMLGEWIDNSLGNGARRITIDRQGDTVTIADDGNGCADLYNMVDIGKSFRADGNRASRYGVGGKLSQISATKAGKVAIETVTDDSLGSLIVDWNKIAKTGDSTPEFFNLVKRPPGCKKGTTITLYGCRRWADLKKIVRDLAHDYAYELKSGKSITIRRNDDEVRVKPYRPPAFSRQVEFDFILDGHPIRGFCGIVKAGEANPYPGWSFHWGYRTLHRSSDPADGVPTNRIYGEVMLPETWDNHSPTKNAFADRPDTLYGAISEHCREIIEAAEDEAYTFELSSASKHAEAIIGGVLKECRRRTVKGRRPGDAGEEGTVEPTGGGSPHARFTHTQPGDKGFDETEDTVGAKIPDRVRISWDDTIEGVYLATPSRKTISLTLNESMPLLVSLKQEPRHLASQCLAFIAYEASMHRGDYRPLFPMMADADYQQILTRLMGRVVLPEPVSA